VEVAHAQIHNDLHVVSFWFATRASRYGLLGRALLARLYLFCTCTEDIYRFSPIEPFGLARLCFSSVGRANYRREIGVSPDVTIVESACGEARKRSSARAASGSLAALVIAPAKENPG
jgi:hypothetical protein